MYINTIQNTAYNYAERNKLEKELEIAKNELDGMKAKIKAIAEGVEDDVSDEIWEGMQTQVDELADKHYKTYMKCFSAQFHRCKNEWFCKVIEGYEVDKIHTITRKQYDCFARYASDTDENHWRDGNSYCRVGNKLVTLHRNASFSIEITLV